MNLTFEHYQQRSAQAQTELDRIDLFLVDLHYTAADVAGAAVPVAAAAAAAVAIEIRRSQTVSPTVVHNIVVEALEADDMNWHMGWNMEASVCRST